MVQYSDEMARHTGVGTVAFIAADGVPGSPYSPIVSGRLLQVKVHVNGDAVTSLIENVTVKLTSSTFGAVPLYVSVNGGQIRTAPAFPLRTGIQNCDLDVKVGVPIVIEIMHVTGATPVTPQIQVIGVFEGPLAA
ncbi:MAG: hypothetical protein V3V47_07970 [Desulfobacteria bacterium]